METTGQTQTKKYIKIQSQGTIDKNAFILMGASTKRDDKSKIGHFGTGLKYAIAYLLRNNIDFKIYSDYEEIKVTTKEVQFKGKTFQQIIIDDIPTSMTTDMGIDWKDWFVIREIYCNAIDQGDHEITLTRNVKPVEGCTVFYIDSEKFKEVIDNFDKYFSFNRPAVYQNKYGKVMKPIEPNKVNIYRKGILVYTLEAKGVYDYDLSDVEINESRIVSDTWQMKSKIKSLLATCDDLSVVSVVLNSLDVESNLLEGTLGSTYTGEKFNDVWFKAVDERTLVPGEYAGFWGEIIYKNRGKYLILPKDFCDMLVNEFKDLRILGNSLNRKESYLVIENKSERHTVMLKKALNFLEKAEYEVRYPIEIVSFLDPSVRGLADREKARILLSERLFEEGLKKLVAVIVEENEHLITYLEDETREFQNLFIYKFVTVLEKITGEYL